MPNHEYDTEKDFSLIENIKEYVKLHIDLLKVNLVEKIAFMITLIIAWFFSLLLFFGAFAYFSIAFIQWTATFWGTTMYGFLIVGTITLLTAFIFYFFRNKIFINPLIRKISSIFFDDQKTK